jgi:hypothetical protein
MRQSPTSRRPALGDAENEILTNASRNRIWINSYRSHADRLEVARATHKTGLSGRLEVLCTPYGKLLRHERGGGGSRDHITTSWKYKAREGKGRDNQWKIPFAGG